MAGEPSAIGQEMSPIARRMAVTDRKTSSTDRKPSSIARKTHFFALASTICPSKLHVFDRFPTAFARDCVATCRFRPSSESKRRKTWPKLSILPASPRVKHPFLAAKRLEREEIRVNSSIQSRKPTFFDRFTSIQSGKRAEIDRFMAIQSVHCEEKERELS
jgi:hypothetical protein